MSRWIGSSTLCALLGLGLCLGASQAKADIAVSLNTAPGLPAAGTGGLAVTNGYTAVFYHDATTDGLTGPAFPIGLGTAPPPTSGGLPTNPGLGSLTTFDPVVVGPNGTFPVGTNWLPNTLASSWLGPNSVGGSTGSGLPADALKAGFNPASSSPQGYFYYDKSFTLTNGGHLVGGLWATDNNGVSIYLNGKFEGNTTPGDTGFISFNAFNVNPGDFKAGTNHIDFVVFNENFDPAHKSPTGLRVEGAVVPEPSTMAVAVLGAIGFIGYGLRRKAKGV